MAAGDVITVFGSSTSSTGGVTSLGSSATWVAGYEWYKVDVDAMSPIPLDVRHSGKIRVGTTPTANTEIRIYLVASNDDSTWPDVFDGTPSAETVTSEGVRDGFAKLVAVLRVDATTSDRDYPYEFKASDAFGDALPAAYVVFVTHNCVAALNATGSTQTYLYRPQYKNVAQS
jgi:hypothetical protein